MANATFDREKSCIFAALNFSYMEAVVIAPRTKSDLRFILDFAKRIGVSAHTISSDELSDDRFISLIEAGLQTPSVSRNEVMEALSE